MCMKIKLPAHLPLLFLLTVLGCKSNMSDANRIHEGMTKQELIAAIGEPASTMSPGPGVEVLSYTFKKQRLYRLAVPLTKDYRVHFVNGRVAAYGTPKELKNTDINVNIRTDGQVAPAQPNVNIRAN